jgi:hypothetical protein
MRDASQIKEHMVVTGSDGQPVGTVDCVEHDEIRLTKNDPDAEGRHHSISLEWVESVEGNEIRLNKLGAEAQAEWSETGACDAGAAGAG